MKIGGIDISFRVKQGVPITEFVLHALRAFWPDYIFQNADEAELRENDDPTLWLYDTASTEFFVYRDREAAESWKKNGGIPENQNLMLHFLIDSDSSVPTVAVQFTMVVGELTGDVENFIQDLKRSLRRGATIPSNAVAV
ncbi:MAG TPA: hypothetical protein VGM05_26360 [Planctomycetaceae bacterium]|jgi:hypothetical protein